MKLSRKSEYACLALVDLAEHYNIGVVRIIDISVKKSIPKKYLEQILLLLKGAGYVKSIKGASGGYKLAKPPEQISLAEIIRLIDGPLAPVESVSKYFFEHTPIEQNEKMIHLFKEIRDYVSIKLENTFFDELI